MRLLSKLIKWFLSTAMLVIALYILSWSFNLLPAEYIPSILFADQIKAGETWVANDATSDSLTSGLSKKLNDYINQTNQSGQTSDEDSVDENNPLDKARKAVDQYQDKIDEERETLDSL